MQSPSEAKAAMNGATEDQAEREAVPPKRDLGI